MARVSYSQYSMYSTCPQKYKLQYIDGAPRTGNIYSIFGSAIHSTIQHYLDVYYRITKKQANTLNLEKLLQEHLIDEFKKASDTMVDDEFVCTREEIEEFYWQGVEILRWFKRDKNLNKFFRKKNYELVGIEVPINVKVKDNVNVIGFIDIILKDPIGNIIIIDLKTSTSGWGSWKRNDDTVKNQIVLYKKWYSEQYNVPIDKISVEFHIMRRLMPNEDDVEFTIPRISRFAPPSGKIKQRQATDDFMWFINEVFDNDGNYIDKEYVKKPGKHCSWCSFNETLCFPNK